MIYSKDDVKKMLAEIREVIDANSFFYKNDSVKPTVIFRACVEKLDEIEGQLSFEATGDKKDVKGPNVCKRYGGTRWCRNGPGCCGDCR